MQLLQPNLSFKPSSWPVVPLPSSIFSAEFSESGLGSHWSLLAIHSSSSSCHRFFLYLSCLMCPFTLLTVLQWSTLDSHWFCYKIAEVFCPGSLSFRLHYQLHWKASLQNPINLLKNLLPWLLVLVFLVTLSLLPLGFCWKQAVVSRTQLYYQPNAHRVAPKSF